MSSNEPVKNGCEVIYEMCHILTCGFEINCGFEITSQEKPGTPRM